MIDERDDELDAALTAMFESVAAPYPRRGFVARTVAAVKAAPVPDGRRALRNLWIDRAGWIAVVGIAAVLTARFVTRPAVVALVLQLTDFAARVAGWTWGLVRFSVATLELFAVIGSAIGRAVATPEAGVGGCVLIVVAAASLAMLNRLLSEKERSPW